MSAEAAGIASNNTTEISSTVANNYEKNNNVFVNIGKISHPAIFIQ
jgi:hypothetical protein